MNNIDPNAAQIASNFPEATEKTPMEDYGLVLGSIEHFRSRQKRKRRKTILIESEVNIIDDNSFIPASPASFDLTNIFGLSRDQANKLEANGVTLEYSVENQGKLSPRFRRPSEIRDKFNNRE